MKLNRKKYLSLAAFIFPVLLIGLGLISTEYEKYKNNQESEKVAKAAATKRQEKNELEIKYNQVHKEEHYQSALTLIKENNYKDAKEMLGKVSSVDDNYKDIKALRADLDEKILRAENEKRIADANQGLIDAEKLLRSDSCSDINTAISKIEYALKVLPSSKKAKEILQKASLNKLRCYQGNGQVLMAIQIQDYEPLKLHVWIKNVSSAVRHANPNHFTLVTVDGRSYSVSTKTYGLSSYFDAVDLQPGTETSGNIVFDTYAKPKKLVYSELLGTSISRDFPFQ
jgi:tetratricopeptide (TPR) repeat protein